MAADETDAEVSASSLDQTERFEAIFDRHAAERSPLSAPPSRRAPRRRADSRDVHARIPRQTAIRHQPRLCAAMPIRHRREPGHDAPAFRTPPRARVRLFGETPIQPSLTTDADGRLDANALGSVLKEALAALSPDQREVLLLHAWGRLSHAEITEALSVQAPSAANAFTAPTRRPPNDASPRVRVSSLVLVSSGVTLAVCCYEVGVIVGRCSHASVIHPVVVSDASLSGRWRR